MAVLALVLASLERSLGSQSQLQPQSRRDMQSKSSTFKKVFRRAFPARTDQPHPVQPAAAAHLNPALSHPVGEAEDTARSAIEASMAALSVASALAKKVPFISPVASLLLQALTMRS
ncbi:hypothetical protein DFH94DRAFT_297683 [Russula ochroleuca]|uniref:Uncharacterized protein n=1 Tax=Russula ochroleuca TaxID=152965 RepID=A0A9P5JWK7_9AGAM|nr:hypothetical protein DFH94DRAFT_297683 [Russula ochroleuca]